MKTIKEYTIIELKALAYDNIAQMEALQANIRLIHEEIASRASKEPLPEAPKEE